jgi:hypothetical protein
LSFAVSIEIFRPVARLLARLGDIDGDRLEEPGTVVPSGSRGVAYDGKPGADAPAGGIVPFDPMGRSNERIASHSVRRAGNRSGLRRKASGLESSSRGLHPANRSWLDGPVDAGDAAILHTGAYFLRLPGVGGESRSHIDRGISESIWGEGCPADNSGHSPRATTSIWIRRCRRPGSRIRPK